MHNSPSQQSFEVRSQAELKAAPPQFLSAFYTLGNVHPQQSMAAFNSVIPLLMNDNPMWAGTAICCYAYCLKEMEQYPEALAIAEQGKQVGFSLMGHWYYYDVVVKSLNMIDDLPRALQAAEAAIKFFYDQRSPDNTASHLGWKANILKQMAAHLSRQEESKTAARSCVIQAIEALCTSLSITSEGLEDVTEEMEALARIATRLDVQVSDLDFLQDMNPEILPFIKQYFNDIDARRMAVMKHFNESVEARKNNDREHAAILLKRALDSAIEQTEEDRAFKAFLAYQHGVNLLKAHNLENYRAGSQLSPDAARAADEIRSVWQECLRLYKTVGEKHLSEFNTRFANITDAVLNIRRDALMRDYI